MFPYEQLVITSQTIPDIPPPFAHDYQLVIDENPSALQLSFRQEYSGRQELTADEILEEGFSLQDDFVWQGSLHKVWKQQLDALLKTTRVLPEPTDSTQQDFMIALQSRLAGETETVYVADSNIQKWVYLIQELKQAIYETDGVEAPLVIQYLDIRKDRTTRLTLNGYFADRTFSVRVDDRPLELHDWSKLQELIRMIFLNTELDPEEGLKNTPVKEGRYLLLPESDWYRFGNGVKELHPKNRVLDRLAEALNKLTGRQ